MNTTGDSARISLAILAHNRRDEVLASIAHSLELPDQAPIVVVDNASVDGTAEAIRQRFPQVTLIREIEIIGAAARNRAVDAVSTPYIAFADDDCQWQAGSLLKAADLFDSHPDIAVLCAHIRVGPEGRDDPASLRMACSPLDSSGLPGRSILGFMAGASAFRVEDYRRAAGFCERLFIGGEEELLALDLAAQGRRMVYCPHLQVRHFPSTRRNSHQRHWLLARNAIWVGWLRLPMSAAVWRTVDVLRRTPSQRLRIVLETALGTGWVARERKAVPPDVNRLRQQIEAAENISSGQAGTVDTDQSATVSSGGASLFER